MMLIAFFLVLIFVFGLFSRFTEKIPITAPMIFSVAGILLVFSFPNYFEGEIGNPPLLLFAEITLAVILFTDATHIKFRSIIKRSNLEIRLLSIGMPLTILAGTIAAYFLFPNFLIWEAAIAAVILAPTDAGLGQMVVSSNLVPKRIRQALSVEAGLNDGLSIPFLMLFIALASARIGEFGFLEFFLTQIGIGIIIGLIIGWIGSWLIETAQQRRWIRETFQQLCLLSLAIIVWYFADMIGGNGFIAAFIAGLMTTTVFEKAGEKVISFKETWGQLLNLAIFFIFGLLAAPYLNILSIQVLFYAILSLTIIRMLPVAISMKGSKLKSSSVLFLGWFGPRGLASIVLGLVYLETQVSLFGESLIILIIVATVLISIFFHGITALLAIKIYARKVKTMGPNSPELQGN